MGGRIVNVIPSAGKRSTNILEKHVHFSTEGLSLTRSLMAKFTTNV